MSHCAKRGYATVTHDEPDSDTVLAERFWTAVGFGIFMLERIASQDYDVLSAAVMAGGFTTMPICQT